MLNLLDQCQYNNYFVTSNNQSNKQINMATDELKESILKDIKTRSCRSDMAFGIVFYWFYETNEITYNRLYPTYKKIKASFNTLTCIEQAIIESIPAFPINEKDEFERYVRPYKGKSLGSSCKISKLQNKNFIEILLAEDNRDNMYQQINDIL